MSEIKKKKATKAVHTRIDAEILEKAKDLAMQKDFNIPSWLEKQFKGLVEKLESMP
ncbi:MAG: hypothetical protein MUC49_02050 [Raineya sp.]|jgi:hypothetical protein|nr:hypothetical protein [Raineya sp.]